MTTDELRQAFIDFFVEHHHHHVASASLIPNDESLLFTNAGMVPFKPFFLGQKRPPWLQATSAQRCVRAGGKHNDLQNVGITARHHTFFEMMGNFSFGDYFKKEAIALAWKFVTEICKLDVDRLWVTVYSDDQESADIWHRDMGVRKDRIIFCGEKDNFWSMGNTGPCGPCTEIFYDHGPSIEGGPPGSPEEHGDRFVEIWNLVFMQYNQDDSGGRSPLPKPCVDTGMGLERMAAVLQGVHDNYDTDVFVGLRAAVKSLPGGEQLRSVSERVIADHLRSIVFLMIDGVVPSNEGRGYVLRRIMRRALCFAYRDGMALPFLKSLIDPVCHIMADALPKETVDVGHIKNLVTREEEQFKHVLQHGMSYLQDHIDKGMTNISGEQAFKLYDTYGFPFDLTQDVATSHGVTVDEHGFQKCMQKQQERSKQSQAFTDSEVALACDVLSEFIGYDRLEAESIVMAIFNEERKSVQKLAEGDVGYLVLKDSVFYPEGGGQVADSGSISADGLEFKVDDVQRFVDSIAIKGRVYAGSVKVNQTVNCSVTADVRQATVLNHSATHLLHAALRAILGQHVVQKGSLVNASYLRFDFSHRQPVSQAQCQEIEKLVRYHIRANHNVKIAWMPLEQAKAQGVMALFDAKYGDKVRVLAMGDFSKELCGGTHVAATGEIGSFKIINETGIASGIRRIAALTGEGADDWFAEQLTTLQEVASVVKSSSEEVVARVKADQQRLKEQANLLKASDAQCSEDQASQLLSQATAIGDLQFLLAELPGEPIAKLRAMVDRILSTGSDKISCVILSPQENGKMMIIAAISKSLTDKFDARVLLKAVTDEAGGGGGGRVNFAQGVGLGKPDLGELKHKLISLLSQ